MDPIILREVSAACQLPVAVYQDGRRIFQHPEGSAPAQEESLSDLFNKVPQSSPRAALFWNGPLACYGCVLEENRTVLLGPIDGGAQEGIRRLQNAAALVLFFLTGRTVEAEQVPFLPLPETFAGQTEQNAERYALFQSEENRDHASAAFERELLRMVREGDVAAMERLLQQPDALGEEHIGFVAADDTKRTEYLCVALLTLMPRAAIEGGLGAEQAHSMADLYLQSLERCRTTQEMLPLTAKAQMDFTRKVKEAQETASRLSYIEDCKNYIAKNLRKPFQVGDIAPAIGVNRAYLSHQFSVTEGLTIQQYIQRERCAHAANLLKFSEYPIALIAEYFCFSSQSHFGKAFKAIYGITPKEYRSRYQRKDTF